MNSYEISYKNLSFNTAFQLYTLLVSKRMTLSLFSSISITKYLLLFNRCVKTDVTAGNKKQNTSKNIVKIMPKEKPYFIDICHTEKI